MDKKIIDVCGALIEREDRMLVAQRKWGDMFGGLWEFPGGKVEPGEAKESAMKRELEEELGIEVEVGKLILVAEDETPEFRIIFHLFECIIAKGEPRPIDCQNVKWVTLGELPGLKLAPVDMKISDWLSERR